MSESRVSVISSNNAYDEDQMSNNDIIDKLRCMCCWEDVISSGL